MSSEEVVCGMYQGGYGRGGEGKEMFFMSCVLIVILLAIMEGYFWRPCSIVQPNLGGGGSLFH